MKDRLPSLVKEVPVSCNNSGGAAAIDQWVGVSGRREQAGGLVHLIYLF